jgi:hypothetical protein
MTLRTRRAIGHILAVFIVAGFAMPTHGQVVNPPQDEEFPPGIQAMRDAITGPAEVYMFRGFLAHGVPPDYNTPEELAENIEAVRAVLAEDCWRIENGWNTGNSGDAIADGFASPVFMVIAGIENLRWTVDLAKNEAFARFDLQIYGSTPTLIGERFKVVDGLVTEIEAFFNMPAAP